MLSIRDAVAEDWPAIWPIVRTVVAAGETHCWPTDATEEAARAWWTGKPDGRVFVAVEDGAVLGTAELHPNQPAAGSHVANLRCSYRPVSTGGTVCLFTPSSCRLVSVIPYGRLSCLVLTSC